MIRGPRPLPLHLTLAQACWQSALLAWHASKLGWPIWSAAHQSNAAQFAAIKNIPDFPAALNREMQSRMAEFQRGIQMYHAHPFRRTAPAANAVWQDGTTRLYDYGGPGQPILIIPSLVNRAYIMDLLPDKSFVQFLVVQGFRPFLVDWDIPGAAEKDFGLSEYITQRLMPIYDFILQKHTMPHVMGYCMGGNLSFALAALVKRKPSSLVLVATPWDFHGDGMPKFTADMANNLMQMVAHVRELPVDFLQSFFTALDPFGGVEKFMRFAQKDMNSDSAKLFVALEDWLSDGVPLTTQVTRDTMQDWYVHNTPMRGQWQVAGTPMLPEMINIPTLTVLPQSDRIVSPASSAALAGRIPGALSLTPPLGHVGMMVSREAEKLVWEPVVGWLRNL